MKNLFLFGAGASYGSIDVNPYPPPLGIDLFLRLKGFESRLWSRFPPEIENLFNSNFERGMEEIWNKYSTYTADLMQSLGKYFSRFSIGEENLYYKFINSLKEDDNIQDCLFSTLIYDCLIEGGLLKNGYKLNYFPEYSQNDNVIPILKLHGSCNFIIAQLQASNIRFSKGIVFEGGVKSIHPSHVNSYFSGNSSLPPVMSIYAKSKPLQVSPEVIKHIQQEWQQNIQKTKKIIVIGVSPNIEDHHIWDFITKTQAKLFYVGNEENFNHYTQNYRKTKENEFIKRTFEDSYTDLINIIK